MRLLVALVAFAAVLLGGATMGRAGSTEPSLSIATVTASTNDGAVTIVVLGNYDHQNVVRLGYPVTIVVTAGSTVARLGLDGGVTVAVGANPPAPVAGPGVVAIAPESLTAALPPAVASAGGASVRLEADYEGGVLRSNAVGVSW